MARPKGPADPFPLIVGVTGHRDIPPAAHDALQHTISTVLRGLQERFGQDAVFVLSALAQGADQLVAGIALDLGLRLIAVSPMPLDDYRATLQANPEATANFEQYWASAQLRLVLPWVTGNAQPRDHKLQYEQLAAVLSRYSHVLLALWDGQGAWHTLHTDAERQAVRGGTAHVLHLRRNDEREAEGFRRSPLFEHASSRLDLARGGPALHIVTPRLKTGGTVASDIATPVQAGDCILLPMHDHPCHKPHDPGTQTLVGALGEHSAREFEQIRDLNALLRGFRRVDRWKHARQMGFLCPSDPAMDPPADAGEHLTFLRNLQAGADTAAQRFQRRLLGEFLPAANFRHMLGNGWKVLRTEWRHPRIGVLFLFTGLLAATVVCFESYAHLRRTWWMLLAYLALPAIGIFVYRWFVKRGEWQNRFQDYRALAEAMRVQIAWAAAAMPRAVSDHYLRLQRDELGWIQFVLRGPALWAAAVALELPQPLRPLVNERWIEDQCEFFLGADGNSGKAALNRTALRGSKAWARRFGLVSLAASLALAGIETAKLIGRRTGWFALPDDPLRDAQDLLLVLIAGAGGVAASFVLSAERRAYEAHAHAYLALGHIFAKAKMEATRAACAQDPDEYRALVFDLGREALAENAAWLQDHRRRPIRHHPQG